MFGFVIFFFLFVFIFLSIFCLSVTWNVDFCITICNIDAHILFSQMIFQLLLLLLLRILENKNKKIVLCMFVQRKHLLFWHLICDCIRKYVNKLVKKIYVWIECKTRFQCFESFQQFQESSNLDANVSSSELNVYLFSLLLFGLHMLGCITSNILCIVRYVVFVEIFSSFRNRSLSKCVV